MLVKWPDRDVYIVVEGTLDLVGEDHVGVFYYHDGSTGQSIENYKQVDYKILVQTKLTEWN